MNDRERNDAGSEAAEHGQLHVEGSPCGAPSLLHPTAAAPRRRLSRTYSRRGRRGRREKQATDYTEDTDLLSSRWDCVSTRGYRCAVFAAPRSARRQLV